MPKKVSLALAICYTLVLSIFSLISIKSLPKLGSSFDDKIFHIFAYTILVLLWYFTFYSLKKAKPILIAVCFSIIYGIIIEVLQGQLTIARSFDILDILANCIGIAIGTLFILMKNRTFVKNL